MNSPDRRLQLQPRKPAAWMLLAIFVWLLPPLGTSLSCHSDAAHDHSAHAATMPEGHAHDHSAPHAHDASATEGSTPSVQNASDELPEPAGQFCCSQPEETPVASAALAGHAGFNGKESALPTPAAVPVLTYELAAPPTVSSRAGPDVPSLYSQLRHSSFSNRAPPLPL